MTDEPTTPADLDQSAGDTTSEVSPAARFSIDLTAMDLTDEEVNGLQNQITRLAAEFARQRRPPGTGDAKKEPYVKIIFVKAIPPR